MRWLSLLRYQKTFTGHKSEVDSKEYFFHSNGKINPKAELEETIKNFTNDRKNLCLFPARAILLAEMKLIPNPDLSHCSKLTELENKLRLTQVSLIFSSYFIEKPASAFGHTFFKLRSKDSVNEDNDLLDYGVDFSAQVTTPNPILYGIMGIFGGFEGKFKLMPYYYKIREYNDMESRDLWSYDLAFTDRDLKMFVAHLIEMEKASFDYYYMGENCSYHVLGFINAIRPDWELMNQLNTFVPPIDTIYALYQKDNIVSKVSYRPSINYKLRKRYSSLSQEEKKYFFKIIKKNNFSLIEEIQRPSSKSNVVEVISDYFDFTHNKILSGEKNEEYDQAMKQKFAINVIRSKLEEKTLEINHREELKNAPHLGHSTRRILIGYLNENHLDGGELEYRFSLHDFLDRPTGWIPFSKTEMGRLNFRYLNHNHVRIDEFSLVGVDAIKPVNRLSTPLSWRFKTGLMDQRFTSKQDISPYLDFALGYSFQYKYLALGFFLRSDQSLIFKYTNHYRLSLGPEFICIFNSGALATSMEINRQKIFFQGDHYITNLIFKMQYNFYNDFSTYLKDEEIDGQKNAYSMGLVWFF